MGTLLKITSFKILFLVSFFALQIARANNDSSPKPNKVAPPPPQTCFEITRRLAPKKTLVPVEGEDSQTSFIMYVEYEGKKTAYYTFKQTGLAKRLEDLSYPRVVLKMEGKDADTKGARKYANTPNTIELELVKNGQDFLQDYNLATLAFKKIHENAYQGEVFELVINDIASVYILNATLRDLLDSIKYKGNAPRSLKGFKPAPEIDELSTAKDFKTGDGDSEESREEQMLRRQEREEFARDPEPIVPKVIKIPIGRWAKTRAMDINIDSYFPKTKESDVLMLILSIQQKFKDDKHGFKARLLKTFVTTPIGKVLLESGEWDIDIEIVTAEIKDGDSTHTFFHYALTLKPLKDG